MRVTLQHALFLVTLVSASPFSSAQDLYQEALEYQQNKQTRAAVIQLKNLLGEQPNHAQARLLLGTLYLESGEFRGAEKELKRAQQLEVNEPRLPLMIMRSQLSQGRAEEILQPLLNFEPNAPALVSERLLLLGHVYSSMNQLDNAQASYLQVESQGPSSEANLSLARLALIQQQPQAALKRAALELANPDFAIQAHLIQGQAQLQQRDGPAALSAFAEALTLQPNHPGALLGKSRSLLLIGNLSEVRNTVDQLLSLVPNYPDALQISAGLYLQDQQPQKAKEILDPLSQQFSRHPEITYLTGYTNLLLGNNAQAEQLLTRNLSNYPTHNPTRLALARYYAQQQQLEQAQTTLQPLLDEDRVPVAALSLAGAINLQQGNPEASAALFKQALAQGDNQAAVARPLAISELLSGETDSGVARLESLSSDQTTIQTDMLLLRAYMQAQQPDKARALLKQRVADKPAEIGYRLLAAMLEVQLQQPQAAEQYLQAALKDHPDSVPAMMGMAYIALQRQDSAGAHHWYDQAILAAPDDIRPLQRKVKLSLDAGQTEPAKQLAAQFYQQHKQQLVAARLYLSVLQHLQLKQELTHQLDAVIKDHPGEPSFKLQQANIHFADGELDTTSALLDKLVTLHPDYSPARLAQVQLALSRQEPEAALALIDSFPPQQQTQPQMRLFQGDAYLALKQPKAALEQYLEAYQIQPNPEASIRVARSYLAPQGNTKAIEFLEGHLKQQPKDIPAYSMLAGLLLQNGKEQEAIQAYQQITQRQANHVIAWNNLAWLYHNQNNPRALNAAEQAHQLAPNAAAVTDTLGWIVLNKDPKRALRLLTEAAQQLPDDPSVQYHYAKALAKNARQQDAIKVLQSLQDMDFSEKTEAKRLLKELKP